MEIGSSREKEGKKKIKRKYFILFGVRENFKEKK